MKRVVRALVAVLSLQLAAACTPHAVEAGHIGVQTDWGEVQTESLSEGLYWEGLLGEEIINMDVRVQKRTAEASASSKDLQVVTTAIALNYRIDRSQVVAIYQNIGTLEQVESTIIDPVLQEAVKTATARYNAEELITSRTAVKEEITKYVTDSLTRSYVDVTDLSIVNFQFDDKYQDAIEAKQVAEQMALTATNDLRRIEVEAQQAEAVALGVANSMLIEARAEAERQDMLNKTLNADLIQWEAIQKWDGKLPVVGGEGAAILDISAIAATR